MIPENTLRTKTLNPLTVLNVP